MIVNMKVRRLYARFGTKPFSERDGRAVTRLPTFAAWAGDSPADDSFRLERYGLSKFRVQPTPKPPPEPPLTPTPTPPMSEEHGLRMPLRPRVVPRPGTAPKIQDVRDPVPAKRLRGDEIHRLQAVFGRNHFTTAKAVALLNYPDFESWAAMNPIQDGLQILHHAGRWHVRPLVSRLAEKVVPRLQQLRQPFTIPAASLMLNGTPITATNQILSTLMADGAIKQGPKIGTFVLVKRPEQWWATG